MSRKQENFLDWLFDASAMYHSTPRAIMAGVFFFVMVFVPAISFIIGLLHAPIATLIVTIAVAVGVPVWVYNKERRREQDK